MPKLTKLSPAPLAYPNGGAIKAMAAKNTVNKNEVYDTQRAALKAKHEQEVAELEFKIKTDAQKGMQNASKTSTKAKAATKATNQK